MPEQVKIADELLEEWWHWCRLYRPALNGIRRASFFSMGKVSRQWDQENEIVDETIRKLTMDAVDWCIGELPVSMQQIIGLEMRNRASKAKVWLKDLDVTYTEAVEAVIPLMQKKNLI